MSLKSCSVVLCDIKSCLLHNSFRDISATPLTSVLNTRTSERDIPVDCLLKKDSFAKENEVSIKRKKKIFVKIIPDSDKENSNDDDSCEKENSDDDDSCEVKKKEESDSDYENESRSREDSDDSDFEVLVVKGQKRLRKEKKKEKKKHSKEPVMSSYEKMIEKKRAERLAFLQSLKMDDIKSDIAETMNSMKKKPKTREKKEIPSVPVRKSERSANVIDYSEKNMMLPFKTHKKNAHRKMKEPSVPVRKSERSTKLINYSEENT